MKCKKVIDGYLSRYDIQEVTIIDGFKILYSGDFDSFYKNCDISMLMYKNDILKRNVVEKTVLGNRKLFLFLEQEAI